MSRARHITAEGGVEHENLIYIKGYRLRIDHWIAAVVPRPASAASKRLAHSREGQPLLLSVAARATGSRLKKAWRQCVSGPDR
jgi:hypothetical protein